MNICFIGIGSIALRHIRNLRELYGDDIYIIALRSGEGKDLSPEDGNFIDQVIYGYDEMPPSDAAFITNPTAFHYETLKSIIDKANSFFVEKPVFLTGEEDCSALNKEDKVFYVACPMRYSNVMRYIKENINLLSVYSVRSICSSYLPDWRPYTDYRRTYSASRRMGGGVSIDLVHEWDYLTYLFGFPKKLKCMMGKKSNLEIDTDDIALYLADYDNMFVELHLDYFGRKPIRRMELFAKDDTIVCDFIKQTVSYEISGKIIDLHQDRDDYQKLEIQHFMEIKDRKIKSDNDLRRACKTLKLARGFI